ncbi:MAG TPA: 3-isopropylmalate dehydratase small subunit [Thermomicrobiales bacterium]|nr:3-isopropylmalate dehydratase small subunit [Thermomicrobiales bacterium]
MQFEGRVWKYGDDVNTDVIIPARYLNTSEPSELAKHAMEDLDETFVKEVQPGDIVVAGKNFGCGSSREHAPIALKAIGVSCIVAESFARIFFRNSINLGLPILESGEAAAAAEKGDTLRVDLATGKIENVTRGATYQAKPFPEAVMKIIQAGGLMNSIRDEVLAREATYAQ